MKGPKFTIGGAAPIWGGPKFTLGGAAPPLRPIAEKLSHREEYLTYLNVCKISRF